MEVSRSMRRFAAALAVLGAVATGAVAEPPAEEGRSAPARVVVGTEYCFMIRKPDGSLSPRERADHIHEIFSRHFGSEEAEFTLQPSRNTPQDRIRILLNGDQVITVTTEDARATRYKNAAELAPLWRLALERAFEKTRP